MRQISLREFRTRGSKALGTVRRNEPILLSGQQGPAYFIVPVLGDVVTEDRELRRALAKASLREGWLLAKDSPMGRVEIEAEIEFVRTASHTANTRKRR